MEIPKVYKALVRTKDGRLVSIWAETLLDYQEWGITYAPKGSMGIFIKTSLEGAKYNGMSNSKRRCRELNGTLVVHEATPLGQEGGSLAYGFSWSKSSATYPAILLGKEVWRDELKEEPRPEPKFKVGDEIIVRKSHTCILTPATGIVKGVKWANHCDQEQHWHYLFLGWVADEDEVELAPQEEWVDVTKECEARIMGSHRVVLYHQYIEIMELSLSKPYITTTALGSAYKVEPTETVLGFGKNGERQDFKILKKVMK